jgi:hypothetical protein
MKRLQISLEPELDRQLGEMARKSGVSKAEVVRRSLRESIDLPPRLIDDPIFELFGTGTGQGRRPGETIDDILYGPRE